jgi:hypothetical protein
MVRALKTGSPRWQNAPDGKIMYKCSDEWLRPGTINKCSLNQNGYSEEIDDRLFDIIGRDSSVLGTVLLRWFSRWADSDWLAPGIERCCTNSGLPGYVPRQI